MSHLSIKNIGPIKDIDIELNRGNPNEPFGAFETTQSDVLAGVSVRDMRLLAMRERELLNETVAVEDFFL